MSDFEEILHRDSFRAKFGRHFNREKSDQLDWSKYSSSSHLDIPFNPTDSIVSSRVNMRLMAYPYYLLLLIPIVLPPLSPHRVPLRRVCGWRGSEQGRRQISGRTRYRRQNSVPRHWLLGKTLLHYTSLEVDISSDICTLLTIILSNQNK